jgi:predicted amidophosphoribosyltransferase
VSDPPLALDQRSTEEQQFIRCMCCEADNSRFAHACIHCGAPLQTDEQRDFNEKFWRQRRSEAAVEQQAVDQIHRHHEDQTEEQSRVQRETFSQMVKEAQVQAGREGQPWGIRMINGLQDPIWQWLLIGFLAMAGLGSAAGLWYGRPDQLGLRWVCTGTLVALVLLFTPPGWWARRTRRNLLGDSDDWL